VPKYVVEASSRICGMVGNSGMLSGCHMPDLMVDGVGQVVKL